MFAAPRVVTPLRILLVLAFAYSLVLLFLSIPGSLIADLDDATAPPRLVWPIAVAVELGVLGVLVIIVCTWKLLTMVKQDRIFTDASLRWVNIIVRTFVIGWAALCVLAAYLSAVIYLTPELRDPGVPMMLFGAVLLGAVLVMLVAVLRALLRRATAMRQDLEEVI